MLSRYWGLLADLVLIVCFAVIGRSAHHEALGAADVARTAWPFIMGCLLGWLVIRIWMRRWPVWKSGWVVWADTLVVGMLLRMAAGDGAHWSFVLVAATVLLVLLEGWRLIWWFARGKKLDQQRRADRRRRAEAAASRES